MINFFLMSVLFFIQFGQAKEISITIDDPEVKETPLFDSKKRNQEILKALDAHQVKAALFVCGMRIDNAEGKDLLKSWDQKGHLIGNHTYSHIYFHSDRNSLEVFKSDFLKVEVLIKDLKNFSRIFRFPYLKEGNTNEKRDGMRAFLKEHKYQHGYVSVDASDWYIDGRLLDRLKQNSKSDTSPYRDFYIEHILERVTFYDDLSRKVFGREIKHSLLLHHNLLNALYLDDVIGALKKKGWKVVSAQSAFNDLVYQSEPDILPAGESIVWASAKQQGKYLDLLRYPAEDGKYEKDRMDKLGL